jgi:hypothetical protein
VSRRTRRPAPPATVVAPALFAVAQHVAMGLPAPASLHIEQWSSGLELAVIVHTIADLHVWAAAFGVPVSVSFAGRSVVGYATAPHAVAGLTLQIQAAPLLLDDQADVDARDRAADIADLVADRAMGLVA